MVTMNEGAKEMIQEATMKVLKENPDKQFPFSLAEKDLDDRVQQRFEELVAFGELDCSLNKGNVKEELEQRKAIKEEFEQVLTNIGNAVLPNYLMSKGYDKETAKKAKVNVKLTDPLEE